MGFATQNIDKVLKSPIGSTLIQATATKLLLPNPEAETQMVAPLYRSIGLNDTQIQNLALARPKRDYYVMSSEGLRMFDLGLGAVTLAFVGVAGKEQADQIRALKREHGAEWVPHWLALRGVRQDWINYLRDLKGVMQ